MPIISKETWDKFTQEEKEEILKDYQDLLSDNGYWRDEFTHEERSGVIQQTEWLFPKEALQPQLTYEDVARELFKDSALQADFYKSEYAFDTYPLNCTSEKQAEKLLAINKLLNVAAYLNKNEDGTPWKPDWKDEKVKKYYFAINGLVDYNRISIGFTVYSNSSIVYFRTEDLAKQTVAILGEDTVRLALTTDW